MPVLLLLAAAAQLQGAKADDTPEGGEGGGRGLSQSNRGPYDDVLLGLGWGRHRASTRDLLKGICIRARTMRPKSWYSCPAQEQLFVAAFTTKVVLQVVRSVLTFTSL
eukprot:scaffold30122_cov18-Tisochrysis_lutea.AAC.1